MTSQDSGGSDTDRTRSGRRAAMTRGISAGIPRRPTSSRTHGQRTGHQRLAAEVSQHRVIDDTDDSLYQQSINMTQRLNRIGLSSVLRPRQHSIGYMGDGFYRSKDPTNSIK